MSFICSKDVSNLPRGSCEVEPDLSGVNDSRQVEKSALNATSSWNLNKFIQTAIQKVINEVPEGMFRLDPE